MYHLAGITYAAHRYTPYIASDIEIWWCSHKFITRKQKIKIIIWCSLKLLHHKQLLK